MSVSIIVPFNGDGAERDRNWQFLERRYRTLYPDWEIVEGTCEPPWRKGMAVNDAVQRSSGDVLVIADADVMLGEQALRVAVYALERSPWVVPHGRVYRLTEAATQAVIADELHASRETLRRVRGSAGGGLAITRREDFDAVGGIDERFTVWGGEDDSFGWALDTMVGPHLRLDATMWHLYHETLRPSNNRASPEVEALADEYREASGNPVAMSALLAQRPYGGIPGGGIVAVRREVAHSIPIDPAFTGWG